MQCAPRIHAESVSLPLQMHNLDQVASELGSVDGASAIVTFEVASGEPKSLVCDGPMPVAAGQPPLVTVLGAVASGKYSNVVSGPELVLRFHAIDKEDMLCTGKTVQSWLEEQLRGDGYEFLVEWDDNLKRVATQADLAAEHAVRLSASAIRYACKFQRLCAPTRDRAKIAVAVHHASSSMRVCLVHNLPHVPLGAPCQHSGLRARERGSTPCRIAWQSSAQSARALHRFK